jgi:diguanylate cyclase (GGDEF)-like protein
LQDRLEQALHVAQRQGDTLAMLFLDLDRFKEVNDTFGHQAGDLLLHEVARRLAEVLRESDTVARLGGDEFAILLPDTGTHGAAVAAAKIVHVFDAPFVVDGRPLPVGASAVAAVFPQHGASAEALMRCADVAMYRAKGAGGGIAVYQVEASMRSA